MRRNMSHCEMNWKAQTQLFGWLLLKMRITKRENNGKFWFDRSIVKENFPLAWTTNTQAEVDDLWNYCVEAFCHSPSV